MAEAIRIQNSGALDYTPAAAVVAGTISLHASGRAAVVLTTLAASELGTAFTEGVFDCLSASATVFSDGEPVYWDDTNNLAVVAGNANASFYLGTAVGAKASGALVVRVDLNATAFAALSSVAVADSTALTNSTTETVLNTFSIPANTLKQGMVLDFLAALIATATNSTDTFRARVRLGGVAGTVVADTTAIDLADNDTGVLRGQIVIREDGASGAFVAASISSLKTTTSQLAVASTAIDTTAATTLVLTLVESVASASNSAKSLAFTVKTN